MSKQDKGFFFFYNWLSPFSSLAPEDFKALFIAMVEYQLNGTPPPNFNGNAAIIADFIFPIIDERKTVSERNARNINQRWKNEENTTEVRTNNDRNTVVTVEKNRIEKNRNVIIPPISPPTEQKAAPQKASDDAPSADVDVIEQRFDRFWSEYPNKTGKQAARVAWRKIKPSEKLTCQMIEKLREMKKTAQWVREGGRFVPNPATWLNQGRWEDEAPKEQAQAAQAKAQPGLQTAPQKERFGNFDHEQAFIAALKRSAVGLGMNEAEAEEFAKQHV